VHDVAPNQELVRAAVEQDARVPGRVPGQGHGRRAGAHGRVGRKGRDPVAVGVEHALAGVKEALHGRGCLRAHAGVGPKCPLGLGDEELGLGEGGGAVAVQEAAVVVAVQVREQHRGDHYGS
jgi:hypothetical protein